MKILQLGKFYPIQGGVEKVMYDLMTGLTENYADVRCDMLCVSADGNPSVTTLNSNSTLYSTKLNKKLFSTMLSAEIIRTLKRICNEYDIIHIHHPDPMVAVALKLSNYKGKVVLHWHSDILKQKLILKFYKPLQDWLIRRADIIVGTSPKYIEESPHLKGFNTPKTVLPIGINPVQFDENLSNKIRDQYPGKHIVFSLGRLVGYKGFEYLVDSAEYLPENCIILIGGSGPLKEDLTNRIKSKGLDNKVKLLGRVSDENLPSYYGACDLFVLSSIWKTEAFGIVQIEAMSCKKPVVATKIPESGVDWVNEEGVSGINVPTENSKALAKAIIDITSNPLEYNQYCNRAYERFQDMFTLERMIKGCRKIYEEVLSSN